jgi:hypothetical protein
VKRRFWLLLVAVLFAACASSSVQKIGTTAYAPLAPGAEVAVYTAESQIKQPFEVVGVISYDNPGKYRIMNLGDSMDRLKEEARAVGGNGIIIDKSHPIKSGIISTGIYVEARAIRVKGL